MNNRRFKYFINFIIMFLLEVIIAVYVKNNIIRGYIGDVLIIICLYFFAKMCFLDNIKNIAIYILVLGILAEMMQYFNISKYIAGNNEVLKIIFGTTFDVRDIICYIAGYIIIKGLEWLNYIKKKDR